MQLSLRMIERMHFRVMASGPDRLRSPSDRSSRAPSCPSARILPWCSTVTLCAMSSTNFMSCSITITERSLMMRLSSSAVLARSLTLMPATGSSSISSSGSCISSMPISSHCFWPWLSWPASVSRLVLQEDHLGDLLDPLAHLASRWKVERAEHRAAARERDLQVLEHREVLVDRRRLELAADAGQHDLVLRQLRQLLASKLDRCPRSPWSCRRSGRAPWSCRRRWGR